MTAEVAYLVKATWLRGIAFEVEEHFISVEAATEEEAREKAQPEIDRLGGDYGKGPSLVGVERRRRP